MSQEAIKDSHVNFSGYCIVRVLSRIIYYHCLTLSVTMNAGVDSDWIDQPKIRVNGSMIKSGRFNGKVVSVIGRLGAVDETRHRFQIDLGDHVLLEARYSGMWSPFLGNLVEAVGMLINGREMLCYSYCSFEPQLTATFDMDRYSKAVSVYHQVM
uniref:Replication protein A 14 kDa subunit n=1 Tax=Trichuris muris TaxID=70415 RepID=A0A5S6QPH3_TRIMR